MKMPSFNLGGNKPHWLEKFLRAGIPIGIGVACFMFWGVISSFLVHAMKNLALFLLMGIPTVGLILYVMLNPTAVWMGYKNICSWITKGFIKANPLGYMDRYVERLVTKKSNLDKVRTVVAGKKIKLERFIKTKQESMNESLRLGTAAMKQNEQGQASTYGTMAASDESSIKALAPLMQRTEKSVKFMDALSENWGYSIKKLQYQIENKRTEFEVIKETYGGLRQAEDFIKGDSEAAKIFRMSLQALEENVTQKLAYMDQFEKDSKDLMTGIKIEKQAMVDEGLSKLEQYMNDGKLTLPDYSSFNKVGDAFDAQTIPYEAVANKELNLLK